MRLARSFALLFLPALAGCILTSGQIAVEFDFPDPLSATSPAGVIPVPVDLNTISEYNDHKDKLKDLADLALLGEIQNNGGTAAGLEFLMTTSPTTHLTAAAVRSDPTVVQLWGPLSIPPGPPQKIDWNASSALFTGRQALLDQVKGDGQFTLYGIAPTGATSFDFTLRHGALVLIIDAGV